MNIHYLTPQKKHLKTYSEKHKRMAFHAAGQAALIYLRNKRMELPSVFFRLLIKHAHDMGRNHGNYEVKVDGGRLIENLPTLLVETTQDFSLEQRLFYEKAFEADVVNILAGPVAEANYIALRDNEIINPRLVNFIALGFYNGTTEMEAVLNYAKCLDLPVEERQQSIIEWYLASFHFVTEFKTWQCITRLAKHILTAGKSVIEADEIIAVLEEGKPESRVKSILQHVM